MEILEGRGAWERLQVCGGNLPFQPGNVCLGYTHALNGRSDSPTVAEFDSSLLP